MENNKLPLKRVELSLSKFNEVAIPHHLDLLRQHRANLIKYEECGQYSRVRAEQTNARRVAAQLRSLLEELEALRGQVQPQDLPAFDRRTQRSRDLTLKAIVDYLGTIENSCKIIVSESRAHMYRSETSPLSINRQSPAEVVAGSAVSTDSVGVVAHAHGEVPFEAPLVQLQVEDHDVILRERESVLRGWSELQSEVRALHDAWQHVQAAALAHRGHVMATASSVETAAVNVQIARADLALSEKIRAGAYGAGGAALGALALGPAGLVLGAKAGAAAALAGSLVGYFTGKLLGDKRQRQIEGHEKREHDKDQ